MNTMTFLKSNYKYKRRSVHCHHSAIKQQWRQWLQFYYRQRTQNLKLQQPASKRTAKENIQIEKIIPSYGSSKLDKFLRIHILIMQQATPANNNNYLFSSKSKSDSKRFLSRLVAQLNAINNASNNNNDVSDITAKHDNKDTAIIVDINNIAGEISYQQHNYDKVSTITSTPIKCQRRTHHQIKRTNWSSTQSSVTATATLTATATADLTIYTLLSTPSIENYETCQWTAILRHYTHDSPSIHKPKHTPNSYSNSLTTSRRALKANNSNCSSSSSSSSSCSSSSSRGTTPSATSIYESVDQHVNGIWKRRYTLSCLLLTLFIAFTISIPGTTAGACWQTVLDSGKCNEIFSLNISKSECCGANQEFAYTEREPTNVEYFFATAIGGGMECAPCLESCMNVKCGPNKKCVKRKGRPKCICAPECGAARRKRLRLNEQQHHHTLHTSVSRHVKADNNNEHDDDNDGYFQDMPSSNAFKIKIEKSQQSRDTRSLSSEITNVNLGLENGKDVLINSGVTSPVERHHCKERNENQRKLIHMHHSHDHRHHRQQQQQQHQQQQFQHQPNHKNQKPKASRRLLITANVEHTEKPTTRRLQIFSNIRTTQARRQNNNNKNSNINNKYGQQEDTDPSDNYNKKNDEDYNYNDAEDDAKESKKKTTNITIGNGNKNNHNNESKRFVNQSPSRHELKTNRKPNNNNKNKNKNNNKNNNKNKQNGNEKHENGLRKTKIRQHSSNENNNNDTGVMQPQQEYGPHAENAPHHRHHNRNHHSQHKHHQQQQGHHHHHRNKNRQQNQNHGRHKHNSSSKPHMNTFNKPKNKKDYSITTAIMNNNSNSINETNIVVVSDATTTRKATAKDNKLFNSGAQATRIDATSSSNLPQTGIVEIATSTTSSSTANAAATTRTALRAAASNSSPQDTQTQMKFLLPSSSPSSTSSSSSTISSFFSTTPLNSAMSADDGAAAVGDHYHSRLPNHGSKIAASSLLSAALFSSSSPTPSSSSSSSLSSSYLQMSAVSARSSVVTTMSATGEGVSLHDRYQHHHHHTKVPTNSTHNKNNSNDDIISALQSNLHNNQQQQLQQQDQQQQTQLQSQSQHHYQTPLFDGFSEQFDLIGFPNNKQKQQQHEQRQQQRITNGEDIRPLNPVCGSDGRTYNTECQLRKRACRTDNPNLQIAYLGHCRTTCNGVKCLNGLTCVEDQYAMPHCIACKIECLQDDYDNDVVDATRAVCGADGKTYKSACDINRMICKIGRAIGVAYPGPCRADRVTCDDINCGPKQVCLIDLLTHKPRCTTCRYKCSRKRRPSSPHYDEGKICGYNNRTYNSWCEMRKDSCATGFFIDVKYAGDCHLIYSINSGGMQ